MTNPTDQFRITLWLLACSLFSTGCDEIEATVIFRGDGFVAAVPADWERAEPGPMPGLGPLMQFDCTAYFREPFRSQDDIYTESFAFGTIRGLIVEQMNPTDFGDYVHAAAESSRALLTSMGDVSVDGPTWEDGFGWPVARIDVRTFDADRSQSMRMLYILREGSVLFAAYHAQPDEADRHFPRCNRVLADLLD